uniref:ANK_REP_REGION domain-containing protein n=2 Tax=Macrostomum lignano TaxID=282301 RepID=A0A1I8IUZ3_9PLAT
QLILQPPIAMSLSEWWNLRKTLSSVIQATSCCSGSDCCTADSPATQVLPCGHSICTTCLSSKRPNGAFHCPECKSLVRGGSKSIQSSDTLTEVLSLVWSLAGRLDEGAEDQLVHSSIEQMRSLIPQLQKLSGPASRKRGAAAKRDDAGNDEACTAEETTKEEEQESAEAAATPPVKISKQKKRQSGRISVAAVTPPATPEQQREDKKTTSGIKKAAGGSNRKEQKKPAAAQSQTGEKKSAMKSSCSPPVTPLQERAPANAPTAATAPRTGRRLAKEARISQSPGLNYSQRSIGNIDKRNRKGETLLQLACIRGDLAKATQLLTEGADPNSKDNAGWTPLHECVTRGHVALARLLLESGANANMPGGDNDTPLHDAVESDQLEVARLLLEFGADPDQLNLAGRAPRQLCRGQAMRRIIDNTKPRDGLPVTTQSTASSSVESAAAAAAASAAARPPQLVSTGLSLKDRKLTAQLAAMIGGTCVQNVGPDVTHLVTSVDERGSAPRTLKFLEAAALGRWIVSFEWVQQCANAKARVAEEPFEVGGTCTLPDTGGPRRSRLNRLQGLPPLLNGCHFHLDSASIGPGANPSRQELSRLLTLAGAQLIAREPKPGFLQDFVFTVPYHAAKDSQLASCAVVVLFDAKQQQQQQNSKKKGGAAGPVTNRPEIEGVLYKSVDWLMDCLTRFELSD